MERGMKSSNFSAGNQDVKKDLLKQVFKFLIGQACIFDNRLEGIRVYSFMVRDGYSVNSIGHADMFASCNNSEAGLAECPHRALGRDICKKHLRRGPLPDIQWNPLFPLLSSGGML